MLYAILSDIHSNLEALNSVLQDVTEQGVDRILCLGDVVGYGANPAECLQIIRDQSHAVVAGNHDHAVAGETDSDYFNSHAKAAMLWTRDQLSQTDLVYLRDLAVSHSEGPLIAVHANLHHPLGWGYILDEFDAGASFVRMSEHEVCFIGHSHVPAVFEAGQMIHIETRFKEYTFKAGLKYIVNVGSVGQPRDGQTEASYALFNSETMQIRLRRISYDVKLASKKIRDAGLPDFLAERLRWGR